MKNIIHIFLSFGLMLSLISLFVNNLPIGSTKADTTIYQVNIETLPASGFLKAQNMAPGDKVTSILQVKNTGNLDFTYAVSAKQTSGATDLYNILQLQVWNNTVKLYEGPLNKLQDLQLGTMPKSGQTDLTFTAILPLNADNSLQGLSATTEFNFAATNPLSPTKLTLSGPTSEDYHDPVTFIAHLTDASTGVPVPNASIILNLGNQRFISITNDTGNASFTIIPNQPAGPYTLSASFAGNTTYLPSETSNPFTITPEETTLDIISSNTLPTGAVAVKAQLKEDGITPIAGRTVTFNAGGVTESSITDANGVATVTLQLTSNEYTLHANFGGDSYYLPSSAASQTLYVYQPSKFVIWGGNSPNLSDAVKPGQNYVFWGAQWAKQVTAGDYQANPSFKGYASSVSSNSWSWATSPGNSSDPPPSVSNYISVIVATHIAKNGSSITGNIAQVVILKVDNPNSYQPNPGHRGSGTMITVVR